MDAQFGRSGSNMQRSNKMDALSCGDKKLAKDLTDIPLLVLDIQEVQLNVPSKGTSFPQWRIVGMVNGLSKSIGDKIDNSYLMGDIEVDDYIGKSDSSELASEKNGTFSFDHLSLSSDELEKMSPMDVYQMKKKQQTDMYYPLPGNEHFYKKMPIHVEMPSKESNFSPLSMHIQYPKARSKQDGTDIYLYSEAYGSSVLVKKGNPFCIVDFPTVGLRDGQIISVSMTPIKNTSIGIGDHIMVGRINGSVTLNQRTLNDATYYWDTIDTEKGKKSVKHYFITSIFLNGKYARKLEETDEESKEMIGSICHVNKWIQMHYKYEESVQKKIDMIQQQKVSSSGNNKSNLQDLLARRSIIENVKAFLYAVARGDLCGLSPFEHRMVEWYISREIACSIRGVTIPHQILMEKYRDELEPMVIKKLFSQVQQKDANVKGYNEFVKSMNVKKPNFDAVKDKCNVPVSHIAMTFSLDVPFERHHIPLFTLPYNTLLYANKLDPNASKDKKNGDAGNGATTDAISENDDSNFKKVRVGKKSFSELVPLCRNKYKSKDRDGKSYISFKSGTFIDSRNNVQRIGNLVYTKENPITKVTDINELLSTAVSTPEFDVTNTIVHMNESYQKIKHAVGNTVSGDTQQQDSNDDDDDENEGGMSYIKKDHEITASQPSQFDLDYDCDSDTDQASGAEDQMQMDDSLPVDSGPMKWSIRMGKFGSIANVFKVMDMSDRMRLFNLIVPGSMNVISVSNSKFNHGDIIPYSKTGGVTGGKMGEVHGDDDDEEDISDDKKKVEKKNYDITYDVQSSMDSSAKVHTFNNIRNVSMNLMNFSTFSLDLKKQLHETPLWFMVCHMNTILDDLDVLTRSLKHGSMLSDLSLKRSKEDSLLTWQERKQHTMLSYTNEKTQYSDRNGAIITKDNSDQLSQSVENHMFYPLLNTQSSPNQQTDTKKIIMSTLKKNKHCRYANLQEYHGSYTQLFGIAIDEKDPLMNLVNQMSLIDYSELGVESVGGEKIPKKSDDVSTTSYYSLKNDSGGSNYKIGCVFGLEDNNFINYKGPNLLLDEDTRKYALSQPVYGGDLTLYELCLTRRQMEELFDSSDLMSQEELRSVYVFHQYYNGNSKWSIDIDAVLKYFTIKLIHDSFILKLIANAYGKTNQSPEKILEVATEYAKKFTCIQRKLVDDNLLTSDKPDIKTFVDKYISPHVEMIIGTKAEWSTLMGNIKKTCLSQEVKNVHPLMFLTFMSYIYYEDLQEGRPLADLVVSIEKKYEKKRQQQSKVKKSSETKEIPITPSQSPTVETIQSTESDGNGSMEIEVPDMTSDKEEEAETEEVSFKRKHGEAFEEPSILSGDDSHASDTAVAAADSQEKKHKKSKKEKSSTSSSGKKKHKRKINFEDESSQLLE